MKMIRIALATDEKNTEALDELRQCRDVWPMADWVEFTCRSVNGQDIHGQVDTHARWLREQLTELAYRKTSNTDRVFWNYAALLVVADALAAFGVEADIQSSVVDLLRAHLTESGGPRSIARKFLGDLLDELQTGPQCRIIHDFKGGDLLFKPDHALRQLRRLRYTYDISNPKTLVRMLKAEKLGHASVPHRLGRRQSRFFLVPAAVLSEFDFSVCGDGETDEPDDSDL